MSIVSSRWLSAASFATMSRPRVREQPVQPACGVPDRKRARFHTAAAASTSAASTHTEKSQLADMLLRHWSWGDMSAPLVQKIAAAAKADGSTHPAVGILAGLGSSGLYPGNCHVELVRKLSGNPIEHALSSMHVIVKNGSRQIKHGSQLMLLPHQLFAAIYEKSPATFRTRILGGTPENITQFWLSMQNHPALHAMPFANRRDYTRKCIPISIHSDGVPVSGIGRAWSRSATLFSWQSMLARGSTLDINFLIFIVFGTLLVQAGGETALTKFSKRLAWSLKWLAKGQWPTEDENGNALVGGGRPLAGGYYACLWAVRGDLDEMAKTYGLNHASSRSPCCLCKATIRDDDCPWTDGRPTASWIATVWTPESWIESHPERHPVFQLAGLSVANFVPDVMHTLHLGVYQWCFGSILKLLTHYIMPGSHAANLAVLMDEFKATYREMGTAVRFNDIRATMYDRGNSDFPRLKGQAAELRHFVPVLKDVFAKHMDPSCRQHKQVKLMLEHCHNLESILDRFSDCYAFTVDASRSFNGSCWVIFQLTTGLANHYHERNIMLFNLTIKFHYMLHLGLICKYINPRRTWCYVGEDFMKRLKHLIQASHFGASPVLVVSKVMRKYVLGLGLNMTEFSL